MAQNDVHIGYIYIRLAYKWQWLFSYCIIWCYTDTDYESLNIEIRNFEILEIRNFVAATATDWKWVYYTVISCVDLL